jgi:hypothetical protein
MSDAKHTTCVEYRPIAGFPGYRVGDDGSIWSLYMRAYEKGRVGARWIIGTVWRRMRYRECVTLCRDGEKHVRSVYRLILEAFIGPCPEGMEACHFDDDHSNNRLSNLRWDTPKANKADAFRNERLHIPRGQGHHASKFSDDQIRAMRVAYASGGMTQRQIAEQHGIDQAQVSRIVRRLAWSHVD